MPETRKCRKFYGDSNINFHLYHYAGNNPIRYSDPDGRIVIHFGIQGNAGAGVGGLLESGFKIGISKEGFSFGVYSSESVGAEFGVVAFFGITIGVDFNSKKVETSTSESISVGGSADALLGIGLDASMDVKSKSMDISASKGFAIKAGVGASSTAVEGHMLYTTTQTQEIEIDNSEQKKQELMNRYYEHH